MKRAKNIELLLLFTCVLGGSYQASSSLLEKKSLMIGDTVGVGVCVPDIQTVIIGGYFKVFDLKLEIIKGTTEAGTGNIKNVLYDEASGVCKRKLKVGRWYFAGFSVEKDSGSLTDCTTTRVFFDDRAEYDDCAGFDNKPNFENLGLKATYVVGIEGFFNLDKFFSEEVRMVEAYYFSVGVTGISNLDFLLHGVKGVIGQPHFVGLYNAPVISDNLLENSQISDVTYNELLNQNEFFGMSMNTQSDFQVVIGKSSQDPLLFSHNHGFQITVFDLTNFNTVGKSLVFEFKLCLRYTEQCYFKGSLVLQKNAAADVRIYVGSVMDKEGTIFAADSNFQTDLIDLSSKFVSMFLNFAIAAEDDMDETKYQVKLVVDYHTDTVESRAVFRMKNQVLSDFWKREHSISIKASCKQSVGGSNCYDDFKSNFIAYTNGIGFYGEEDITEGIPDLIDPSNAVYGTRKCFIKSGFKDSNGYCDYCSLFFDNAGSVDYYSPVERKCMTKAEKDTAYPANDSCSMSNGLDKCHICVDGKYLNRNQYVGVFSIPTCMDTCDVSDVNNPVAIQETAVGGVTMRYCDQCRNGCTSCNHNNQCQSCLSELQMTNGSQCTCLDNCELCITSKCDRCKVPYFLHQDLDTTRFCGMDRQNCMPGYGREVTLFVKMCRPCLQDLCPNCLDDWKTCGHCNEGEGLIDLSLHPVEPKNEIGCVKMDERVDYYFYYSEDNIFKRCLENCQRCNYFSSCFRCHKGFLLENQKTACVEGCRAKEEYWIDSTTCGKCSEAIAFCEECEEEGKCLKCKQNFEFDETEKLCSWNFNLIASYFDRKTQKAYFEFTKDIGDKEEYTVVIDYGQLEGEKEEYEVLSMKIEGSSVEVEFDIKRTLVNSKIVLVNKSRNFIAMINGVEYARTAFQKTVEKIYYPIKVIRDYVIALEVFISPKAASVFLKSLQDFEIIRIIRTELPTNFEIFLGIFDNNIFHFAPNFWKSEEILDYTEPGRIYSFDDKGAKMCLDIEWKFRVNEHKCYLTNNIGSIFTQVLFILAIFGVLKLMRKKDETNSYVQDFVIWALTKVGGQFWVGYFMAAQIEILVASFVNLKFSIPYSFFAFVHAVLSTLLIAGYFFLVYKHFDISVRRRSSFMFLKEDLKHQRASYYKEFELVRDLLIPFFVVILSDNALAQIIPCLVLKIIGLVYLVIKTPYREKRINIAKIFNSSIGTLAFSILLVISIKDSSLNIEPREGTYGYMLITVSIISFVFNFFMALIEIFLGLKKWRSQRKSKRGAVGPAGTVRKLKLFFRMIPKL